MTGREKESTNNHDYLTSCRIALVSLIGHKGLGIGTVMDSLAKLFHKYNVPVSSPNQLTGRGRSASATSTCHSQSQLLCEDDKVVEAAFAKLSAVLREAADWTIHQRA